MRFDEFIDNTSEVVEDSEETICAYVYLFIDTDPKPQLPLPLSIFTEAIEEVITNDACFFLLDYYKKLRLRYETSYAIFNTQYMENKIKAFVIACETLNAFYISFMNYISEEEFTNAYLNYRHYHIPPRIKEVICDIVF